MTSGPRALSVWAPTDRLDGGQRVEARAGASAGGRPSIPSHIPSRLVSAEPLPARCSRPPFRPLRLLPLLPWLQRWWRDLCSLKTDIRAAASASRLPRVRLIWNSHQNRLKTNPLPATCRLDVSSLHREEDSAGQSATSDVFSLGSTRSPPGKVESQAPFPLRSPGTTPFMGCLVTLLCKSPSTLAVASCLSERPECLLRSPHHSCD